MSGRQGAMTTGRLRPQGHWRTRVAEIIEETAAAERGEAEGRGVPVERLGGEREREEAGIAAGKARVTGTIEGEIERQFAGYLSGMSFGSFDPVSPAQEVAEQACAEWADRYCKAAAARDTRPVDGMLLFGRNGRGKTHLAVSILRRVTSPATTIRFCHVPEFLAEMKQAFNAGPEANADVLLQQCKDADVLVLDDLGQERATEWVVDTLGALIFHRHREQKPIIVTSNLSVRELNDRADGKANAAGFNLGAIYSRLREMVLKNAHYFDGADFRSKGGSA